MPLQQDLDLAHARPQAPCGRSAWVRACVPGRSIEVTACTRIADEGGGQLAVCAKAGELAYTVDVAASRSPYGAGLSASG